MYLKERLSVVFHGTSFSKGMSRR